MAGGLLNGRYELHEPLGTGGMATVWRGVDRVLGRTVAVKVMNHGLADDPRFADRFAREARHAAMLLHPAIVTVFDTGVDEHGTPYLVMEFVDGSTLAQLLADSPRLPVDRAVAIASAVCDALQVAHAAGLVHRDIKPGNIMVARTGEVKVVDFGIAKAGNDEAQLTGTGAVLGTASYLAPEQATAAEVDGRTDLYALGCVLTEMLTGRPPFVGTTPVEIAWKHVSERPAAPSALRPDIPPALDAAVLRLLAKEPGRRPADAATARAELQAATSGAGVTGVSGALRSPGPTATPLRHIPQQRGPLNHTVAMPPLEPPVDFAPAVAPRRRRTPLVVAGVAVAAACVVAAAVASQSGPSTPTAGGSPTAQTQPQTTTAPPSPSPSAQATGPAGVLAALRDDVAAADLPSGQQQDLLDALDGATQALADQNLDDAARSVHDAQRVLRRIAKGHALDQDTLHTWQSRLNSVSTALHRAATTDAQSSQGGNG